MLHHVSGQELSLIPLPTFLRSLTMTTQTMPSAQELLTKMRAVQRIESQG